MADRISLGFDINNFDSFYYIIKITFFFFSKRQFMSDLVNLSRDSLYDNLKHAIFDKLEQDSTQLNALEE